MPSVGRITTRRTPFEGDGLRMDAGYRADGAVTPYYDAILAKVTIWGATREAVERFFNKLRSFRAVAPMRQRRRQT